MKNIVIFVIACLMLGGSEVCAQAIVADHNSVSEFDSIPEAYIDSAKSDLRLYYGHTSHGSQVVSGMSVLQGINSLFTYHPGSSEVDGALSLVETSPDLGYPEWVTNTTSRLDTPSDNRNVVVWSWCGQQSTNTYELTQQYLDEMAQLETDYPDVTFIYMTGHLDATGSSGNLYERNDQIRDFVNSRAGILFDFEDIERYDPDGNDYLDLGAGYESDGCQYSGGAQNWCTSWCDENPDSDLCESVSCAHSSSLNCNIKARAFWWLLARVAGWTPEGSPETNDDKGAVSGGCGSVVTRNTSGFSLIIICMFILISGLYRRKK